MIDRYFRRPLFWDYLLAAIGCFTLHLLLKDHYVIPSSAVNIWSMSSELSLISLTLAGFILTLLTVLITFKSRSTIKNKIYNEASTVFEVFFATEIIF